MNMELGFRDLRLHGDGPQVDGETKLFKACCSLSARGLEPQLGQKWSLGETLLPQAFRSCSPATAWICTPSRLPGSPVTGLWLGQVSALFCGAW